MNRLTAILWLLTATLSACAQQSNSLAELHAMPGPEAVEPSRVYTYVEQMPQLPGGGGQQRLCFELLKHMDYPSFSLKEQMPESRVKLAFIVNTDGTLQDVKLLASSHNAAIDKALVAAAYTLPHLVPGYQNGQPVRVQLTFPIILEYR